VFWGKRHLGPIGLDFGSSTIRLCQLDTRGAQIVVHAAVEVPRLAETPGRESESEPGRVAPAPAALDLEQGPPTPNSAETMARVRQALDSGGFEGRRVVTALTEGEIHVKNLRLPPMPEEELAAAVRYEAGERFGFDSTTTEYRCLLAGTVRSGNETQQELAVLAAPDDPLRSHLAVLTELGLTAEAVDAVPCAVFRPFERFLRRDADADEVHAFADVGYSGTWVVVARGRDVVFLKHLPVGGSRFDALVAEQWSLSAAEARRLRREMASQRVPEAQPPDPSRDREGAVFAAQGGPLPHGRGSEGEVGRVPPAPTADEILTAIQPAVEQLGKEIGLCLRYCAVTFRGPRCESVTCVGGEARSAELLTRLSQAVGVPLRQGHPLRGAVGDGIFSPHELSGGLPEWTVALGLALKMSSKAG